jgi:hypothetical protein
MAVTLHTAALRASSFQVQLRVIVLIVLPSLPRSCLLARLRCSFIHNSRAWARNQGSSAWDRGARPGSCCACGSRRRVREDSTRLLRQSPHVSIEVPPSQCKPRRAAKNDHRAYVHHHVVPREVAHLRLQNVLRARGPKQCFANIRCWRSVWSELKIAKGATDGANMEWGARASLEERKRRHDTTSFMRAPNFLQKSFLGLLGHRAGSHR